MMDSDKKLAVNCKNKDNFRILLVEANNQRKWVGSRVVPEVHIPPIGLLYLASYAQKENPGLQVKIIETSLDTPSDEDYIACLREYQPDLVGIRSICLFFEEFKNIAVLTKSWRDIPVVGGGPIASVKKDLLLTEIDAFDMIAINESELSFSHILSGRPIPTIGGLYYRDQDSILNTGKPQIIDNLDELPFPDYDLINLENYDKFLSYSYNHRPQGVILSSRGCPYKCTYCNTFGGKTVRLRSAENVYDEMNQLWKKFGISDFYFVDDIFNINKERATKVLRSVIDASHDWKIYFVNGLRADLMTRELVDLMIEAGTVWITYGIESASPRIQNLIRKNLDLETATDIINYTQEKGIVVNINTMYGFPTETPEEAKLTLDYMGRLNMPSLLPYHFCLRFFEGCEIVNQANENGWNVDALLSDNILSYNSTPNGTPTFPRQAMLDHIIEFHELYGTENKGHLKRSIGILQDIGYTDVDLIDMYSVLLNRPLQKIEEITTK